MIDKTQMNKAAIVTGSRKGLRKAAASALADRGASVAITDVNENAGRSRAERRGDTCQLQ
jgi:NAD(P)-dependent dehydrogenase (short-subunit alcohol dehydrogenase family)